MVIGIPRNPQVMTEEAADEMILYFYVGRSNRPAPANPPADSKTVDQPVQAWAARTVSLSRSSVLTIAAAGSAYN
jgi:hypothetical protein